MTAAPAGRLSASERDGLTALLGCVDAARSWDHLGPAAQDALRRARPAPAGTDPALPATIHAPTRLRLIHAGLAYRDGVLVRVTALGQRVTAWACWQESGHGVRAAFDPHLGTST